MDEWFPRRMRMGEQPCGDLFVVGEDEPFNLDEFRPPLRRNNYRWNDIVRTWNPLNAEWVIRLQPDGPWWRYLANDRVIDAALRDPRPIVPGNNMNIITLIFMILYRRLITHLQFQQTRCSILFRLEGIEIFEDTGEDMPRTWFGQIYHDPGPSTPGNIDRMFYCNLFRIWRNFISRQNGAVTHLSLVIIPLEPIVLAPNTELRTNPFQARHPLRRRGDIIPMGRYTTNLTEPSFARNLEREASPPPRRRLREDEDEDEELQPPRRRLRQGGVDTDKFTKEWIGPYLCISHPSSENNCLLVCITRELKMKVDAAYFKTVRKHMQLAENTEIDVNMIPLLAAFFHCRIKCYDEQGVLLVEGGVEGAVVKLCLSQQHYWIIVREQTKDIKCQRCGKKYKTKHTCNDKRAEFYQQHIHRNRIGVSRQKQEEVSEFQPEKCLYFDMETFYDPENGCHVPYAIGWYDVDYQVSYGRDCMKSFIRYLEEHPGKILIAYNGSRFDFQILLREYMKETDVSMGNLLFHGGRLLQAEIGSHRLFDLCAFTSCSLASACKNFGVDVELHKTLFPHRFIDAWEKLDYVGSVPALETFFYKPEQCITEEDRATVSSLYPEGSVFDVKECCLKYLRLDVLGMREVMIKFAHLAQTELQANLVEFITLGHLTYKQWLKTLTKEIVFAHTEKDYHAMREAYYGGRVYPVKRSFTSQQYEAVKAGSAGYEDVTDFISDQDVNSLYPTVMKEFRYPIGDYTHRVYDTPQRMLEPFIDTWAICKVQYVPPSELLHPVLPFRGKNGLLWDLQPRSGWFTSVDLDLAFEKGYTIHIEEGYYWYRGAYIFDEYLQRTIAIKDAGTRENNPVKRQIGKLLSNSLYGKFAQAPMANVYEFCRTDEDLRNFCENYEAMEFYVIGNAILLTGLKKESLTIDRPHFIGAFITAYARVYMYRYYDKANPSQRVDDALYYTDTDSMHIPGHCLRFIQDDLDPVTLGKLSNDIKGEGKIIKAVYVAPKLYYLEYITKTTTGFTIKSKGVNPDYLDPNFFHEVEKTPDAQITVDMGLRLKSSALREPILQHWNVPLTRTLNQFKWEGRRWEEKQKVWYPWNA